MLLQGPATTFVAGLTGGLSAILPLMRDVLAHAKLHAFYLSALWLWGGVLVVLKWWIAFDAAVCVLLALAAVLVRLHRSWSQSHNHLEGVKRHRTAPL